ncbi:MAG: carboxypeptidase regulatory-like domain-containing protein, partial [Gammaproteobacteria bacterium]|nr:carboxypeptidase regulatory-like domain-containing protein [Gammaproteobacteria bacterium]
MANATVTAVRSEDGAIRATISAGDGLYSFGDLPPGAWTVSAQLEGLPAVQTPAVVVVTGRATRSDLVMNAPPAPTPAAPAAAPTPSRERAAAASAAVAAIVPEALQAPAPAPAVDTQTPFAVGDLGWMNGT